VRRRPLLLVLLVVALTPTAFARRRRATHGNPHAEVTAIARVEDAPRRTTHGNDRSFEELSVVLISVDPPEPALGDFQFDTRGPVRIVHDLTCGGIWIDLHRGDRVDIRGEYVHTPDGRDLIHFTHPADASCGRGSHVDGYLRLRLEAAAALGIAPEAVAAFRASLRPILSVRCAPCHEPGGKMYARLPFDDPATVAAHASRMAGRLSGEDRRTLERWAAGTPPRSE
jgi:hypothetical protein